MGSKKSIEAKGMQDHFAFHLSDRRATVGLWAE